MVEDTKQGEEKGMSAPPLPVVPVKRLIGDGKQSGPKAPNPSYSSSSPYPFRARNPNLTICQVCKSQTKGKEKLQTLDSQWRIVLLCKPCFTNVRTAKICSYCFDKMSGDNEEKVICCYCKHHVHQSCYHKYPGFNMCCDIKSFTCIDCWAPKSINGFRRRKTRNGGNGSNESNGVGSNAGSVKISRESSDVGVLEDAAKDAKSTAEKKLSAAVRAKEKAVKKAEVARRSAERAASVLDLAVVAAREETKVKGGGMSIVDDAELAYRLHRAINSSSRIIKNLSSIKLKSSNCDSYTLTRKSNLENLMVRGVRAVSGDGMMVEKTDKAVSELAVQIGNLGNGSLLEARTKMDMVKTIECRITYKRRLKKEGSGVSCCKDSTAELPVKEEQGSCSNMVCCSSGTNSSADSRSQSAFVGDSSLLEKRRCDERFVKKYIRRGRGSDRCFKKYSRRNTILKQIFDGKTKFPLEDFPLDRRASAPATSLLSMNRSNMSSFYEASSQSSSVPFEASASASGPFQS